MVSVILLGAGNIYCPPSGLLPSDPISAMRPAVYPPVTLEGRLTANDNSPFHFDQELGESAGLYKPAVPDPQHHTWAYTSAATSAKPGPPSPSRNLAAQATGAGLGLFTPFSHAVNALTSALRWKPLCQSPQPFYAQTFSSSLRVRLPQASHAPPDDTRKRRRNRSTAIYRPAKRSPPRGHWCEI